MLATRQAAVEAFLAANEQRRHHFVQELVDRWSLAPEASSSTLSLLLAASSQSPARLSLIHSTLASTLAASLLQAGHQAAQHNAAVTAAHVLSQHGPALLPALVAALGAAGGAQLGRPRRARAALRGRAHPPLPRAARAPPRQRLRAAARDGRGRPRGGRRLHGALAAPPGRRRRGQDALRHLAVQAGVRARLRQRGRRVSPAP